MNKKLIAIGIAAALALPMAAAQAGVEVYGKARVSVDFNNNGDDNTGQEKSNMSVSSNASRVGLKGDEDLGDGMTAVFLFENPVNFDTGAWGSAAGSARQSYVGLAGGFGTVLAGRLDTPYKSSTNSWDPFIDTKADYNNIMNGPRVSNTLAYVTNNMNGFKAALAYVMPSVSSGSDALPMTKTAKKQSAIDLGANYDNGPLGVAFAYEVLTKSGSTKTGASEPDDATFWKLGAKYMIMDATSLALIYENQDVGGTVKDHNNIYFAASHKMGDTTLKLAYTKADKWGGITKSGADMISVGVSQALSKNTEVYALYSQISNEDNAAYGLTGGPASVTKASGVASDPSVLSIGINHNFSSK